MKSSILTSILIIAVVLTGCSAKGPVKDEVRLNKIHDKQLPSEKVYGRLKWVYAPSTLPDEPGLAAEEAPKINKIVHFTLKKGKLSEAATALASISNYSSYCSSEIADRPISLDMLGTIDEIAEAISQNAGISVVVDHSTKAVQFFPFRGEAAQLLDGESTTAEAVK